MTREHAAFTSGSARPRVVRQYQAVVQPKDEAKTYRIEISPNARAGCKASDCKDSAIKITKGELRMGVWVAFQEHGSWHWRHWYALDMTTLCTLCH